MRFAYVHSIRLYCILFSLLSIFSTSLHAAGVSAPAYSITDLGNAYAGNAAIAENASTIFANPAGMVYLNESQLVMGVNLFAIRSHFSDQGSSAGTSRTLGNEGGNLGDLSIVPNFYYAIKLNPELFIGIGINSPFAIKSDYDQTWLGRFNGTKSVIKTININPALAYKVNDKLALGAGVSAMRVSAELNRQVNFVTGEGSTSVKGNDWGFGYNFGAILQITPSSRLGLSYRSQVKQQLEGTVTFVRPAAIPPAFDVPTRNGGVTADTTLPDSFSVSGFSQINDDWALMADVTWTNWSKLQKLDIIRDNGQLLSSNPHNWSDAMRYSIGATYRYNHKLKLRTGIAFDQDVIADEDRTVRIPTNDQTWLAIGGQYKFNQKTALDIGYAHLFVKDAAIDESYVETPANLSGRVKGKYKANADILGLQLTHSF